MGLIKNRKKRTTKGPSLTLRVHVVQVQNVSLFQDFKCNPICVVTTNSVYSKKTSKLRNSRTKWDEILKLKLASKPSSEWLRIVVYDALPTSPAINNSGNDSGNASEVYYNGEPSSSSSGQSIAGSGQTRVTDPPVINSSNSRNNRTQNSYLYVGEAKISLLELFKRRDTTTSYKFSLEPAWFTLYDRRLQRQQKDKSDSSSCVVGEVQLGFRLTTSSKKLGVIQVYNGWKNSLVATLKHRQNIKKAADSRKNLLPLLSSESEKGYVKSDGNIDSTTDFDRKDDDDDIESYIEYSDNEEYGHEELDGLVSDYNLLSEVASIDSDVVTIPDGKEIDISSMVPVLDEYDVVDTDVISGLSKVSIPDYDEEEEEEEEESAEPDTLNHPEDIYDEIEIDGFEEEDDIDEDGDEDTDDITIRNSGSRLKQLRRSDRPYKLRSSYISQVENYKISKKQHAAGVVFVEFKDIKSLPSLKNKVSRRSYDMDPFIIAVFGRRVFKTSWRKHSLNPVFNECAAFEVFPEETHFGFHFNVLDKDSFSYNDKIAHCDLPWSEMISKQTPDNDWVLYELPLKLTVDPKESQIPTLSLRIRFIPYATLKKFFWKNAVSMGTNYEEFNIVILTMYLDNLGSFTVDEVCKFFTHFGKLPWAGDIIKKDQLIEFLQTWKKSSGFKNVWKCPKCYRSCKPTRNTMNTKLVLENDLITHFSVCSYERKCKLLKPSYVSSDFASKRWFSRVLIKLTYGKYALGSNNANILVQDRDTGIILEEKISGHVKLGMRIIYNGKGKESRKFKALLKSLSIRQGKKFDDPASTRQIESFIKFHSLNMSECEEVSYKTFNEFFYRRLKAGSRNPEGESSKIFVSPADSRCTVFSTIHQSKEVWIKSSRFTLGRLTGNYKPDIFNDRSCSISVFRLAPQDYHRFHCPCNAIIGKPIHIDGEYYTVNPMAIRSSLDVFGENVRMIIPLESPEFGTLLCIPIGAMMVGSIILTRKEGDYVKRGEELGYFKFGGSTIVIVIPSKCIEFDTDLSKNSVDGIETLVKVGMSVGHAPDVKEHKRERIKVVNPEQMERIKRTISVTDGSTDILGNTSWEYHTLKRLLTEEYDEPATLTKEETPSSGITEHSSSSPNPT